MYNKYDLLISPRHGAILGREVARLPTRNYREEGTTCESVTCGPEIQPTGGELPTARVNERRHGGSRSSRPAPRPFHNPTSPSRGRSVVQRGERLLAYRRWPTERVTGHERYGLARLCRGPAGTTNHGVGRFVKHGRTRWDCNAFKPRSLLWRCDSPATETRGSPWEITPQAELGVPPLIARCDQVMVHPADLLPTFNRQEHVFNEG